MSDPAIIAAIIGAVLTAALTPFVPWLVSRVPFLQDWFLKEGRPLRFVAAVSALTAILVSIFVSLIFFSIFGGSNSGKIKISIDEKANNISANGFILSDINHDKICSLTKIIKHGGSVDEGTMAGSAEVLFKNDHWEASYSSGLDAKVTCFNFAFVR